MDRKNHSVKKFTTDRMTIDEVLEKHFKDQRVRYYRAPDLIHADHYLRYRIVGGRVVLSVGNDEGEVLPRP